MTVIVISKDPWNIVTHKNASAISLSSGTYTITVGGNTYTYAKANYYIRIMES